jgi:hypothetical protein
MTLILSDGSEYHNLSRVRIDWDVIAIYKYYGDGQVLYDVFNREHRSILILQ